MKDHNKELEALFANSRLTPDAKFTNHLKKSLVKQPRSSLRRLFAPLAAVGMIVVLLLGVSLIQPEPPKQLAAKSVLIRALYAQALADELPAMEKNTFWSVTNGFTYGPAAPKCGYSKDFMEESASTAQMPTTTLYYNDGKVSAYYAYGGYANNFDVFGYSSDPDVKAFDTDQLISSESSQIRGVLLGAMIVDIVGNPLPKNATTPFKSEGVYDIYAKVVTTPENTKDYIAGCETLLIHIQIDAAKGDYNFIKSYRDTIAEENLFYINSQIIETKRVKTFDEVRPIFEAAGFDLEKAKAKTAENDYLDEKNQAIGIQFFYRKSALGKPTLATIKNTDGVVTEYRYSFSRQPLVNYSYRTPAGVKSAEYKTVADLKAKAISAGWTIIEDQPQDGIILSGYGQVKSHYFKAHDGQNYYVMIDSGSTDIPSVFVTIPYGLGDYTVDSGYGTEPYVANDLLSPASSTLFYKPGTEPPKGL